MTRQEPYLAGPTDGGVEFEKLGHPGGSALSQAMLKAQQQDEKDQNEEQKKD